MGGRQCRGTQQSLTLNQGGETEETQRDGELKDHTIWQAVTTVNSGKYFADYIEEKQSHH